jgi:NCS2 family nucleobase:cation symporter-2
MTTFPFTSVAVSGLAIISKVPFTRRNRFIMTAALALGFVLFSFLNFTTAASID